MNYYTVVNMRWIYFNIYFKIQKYYICVEDIETNILFYRVI